MALQISVDLRAEQQPTQDSRVKLEEPDVQVQVQTQSRGSGGQRESSGQDPPIFDGDYEQQQETNIQ